MSSADPTGPSGLTDTENRALRSVAIQFWVNGVVFASFIPRLPEIRAHLDIELAELGVLLTMGSLGGLAGSAVCGRLIERLGTKTVMTFGAFGMVMVLPVIGLAGTPLVLLGALMALQLFDVFTDVAMNLQGSWLSGLRTVPVINRLHGLWSLGTVVGGILATVAATFLSLPVHLITVALVLAVTLLYVAPGLLTADQRATPTDYPSGERDAVTPEPNGSRLALLFTALAVMGIGIELVPTDWAAVRLVEDFDVRPSRAGLGFVAMTSGMVVGRFGGDTATATFGRRRLLTAAAILNATGLTIATLVPNVTTSIAGFFLTGLGAAVIFPGLYDIAARSPGRLGAMLGAMSAGIRVGLVVFPAAVGFLASSDHLTVGAAMAIVTLPAALGLLLFGTRAG